MALYKVYNGDLAGSVEPTLDWVNPFKITDTTALSGGLLAALFIYWGWDTAVAVNEECADSKRTPGIAAVVSTLVLVATEALGIARSLNTGLVLMFCTEPPSVSAGGAGDQRDVIASIGEEILTRATAAMAESGVAVRGELVNGRPVDGLIAIADQVNAPMIVVGHHGEGPLRGALLGATANKLLHQAERPVLVVPSVES